jgi:hypothetical protein
MSRGIKATGYTVEELHLKRVLLRKRQTVVTVYKVDDQLGYVDNSSDQPVWVWMTSERRALVSPYTGAEIPDVGLPEFVFDG